MRIGLLIAFTAIAFFTSGRAPGSMDLKKVEIAGRYPLAVETSV